jgi:hypothetical protein
MSVRVQLHQLLHARTLWNSIYVGLNCFVDHIDLCSIRHAGPPSLQPCLWLHSCIHHPIKHHYRDHLLGLAWTTNTSMHQELAQPTSLSTEYSLPSYIEFMLPALNARIMFLAVASLQYVRPGISYAELDASWALSDGASRTPLFLLAGGCQH